MIELNTFKKILEENEERLPLLTLDEFFDGHRGGFHCSELMGIWPSNAF